LLTDEQVNAVAFITSNPHGVIIAPTGVGKTIISLTAIAEIKQKVIVAAPPKVLANWPVEAQKWDHTKHLKLTILDGPPEERLAKLQKPADVLLVSLNSLGWLLDQKHNATAIIIDELSKAAGKQTAKLKNKKTDQIKRRYGLTATPVSESFIKLYAMFRIIDGGQALGRNNQLYLQKYFYPTDYKQYRWKLSPGSDLLIMSRIKHLIYDVKTNKADTLPPIEHEEIVFDMPPTTRALYAQMKTDLLIETQTGADAVAVNLAVLSGKLRQLCSGFVIAEDGSVIDYDHARAQTLIKVLPATALIIYEYDHQRKHIEKQMRLHDKRAVSVYGGSDAKKAIKLFKDKQVDYLIAQQNTLSHGIDGLQYVTNNIIFYQPLWSNDNYVQAIGRIWRQGSPFNVVTSTTLVCDNTIDDLVINRLNNKAAYMDLFLQHLRG
jgi:SNF2 family DNA or RNA helicase